MPSFDDNAVDDQLLAQQRCEVVGLEGLFSPRPCRGRRGFRRREPNACQYIELDRLDTKLSPERMAQLQPDLVWTTRLHHRS